MSFGLNWPQLDLNEGGPGRLGDQRVYNGAEPVILTPEALPALETRVATPPEDGGQWSGPKVARWLASFHELDAIHDRRGWDALVGIAWSIQMPRPRHPETATEAGRAGLKKLQRAAAGEPLATTCFETLEDLDKFVADRCAALTHQCGIIRASTLFHWWPRLRPPPHTRLRK